MITSTTRRCIIRYSVVVVVEVPGTGIPRTLGRLINAALAAAAPTAAAAQTALQLAHLPLVDAPLQTGTVYRLRRIGLPRYRTPQHRLLQALDAPRSVVAVGRHQVRHDMVRHRRKLLLHLVKQLHNRYVRAGTGRPAFLQQAGRRRRRRRTGKVGIRKPGGIVGVIFWRLLGRISRHNRPSSDGSAPGVGFDARVGQGSVWRFDVQYSAQ